MSETLQKLLDGKFDHCVFPFLWVHGEDEATYRSMIGVIQNANMNAFCVEARPHDGFCGETWWRDMDIILDEAEKRGMKVWILDDKHFPTGFAAGRAMDAPPEQRRQSLFLKTFPVKGRIRLNLGKRCHPPFWKGSLLNTQMYLLTNIMHRNNVPACKFDDDRVFSAAAFRTDISGAAIDLSGYVRNGRLDWRAPDGKWAVQLCCLSRNLGSNRAYINMMDRDSCRIQLDAVYEPHFAHYADKFGSVIAGFFSDEPELGNNYMYRMNNPLGTEQDLPWSRELESALRERLGEGFGALLPLLWYNGGDPAQTERIRYTYMDCVSRLVEEDFSCQIGAWCREHGVEYTGHIVEDNNQHARTGTSLGHYFRGLKGQTMAGIDDIGGQVCPGGEDKRTRHPLGYYDDGEFYHYSLGRLGTSLGALNPGMNGRTMCEIFGNYGWKEGVKLEKYLIDHFMVRGVNRFVPHAFTCSAYPEKDCPPQFYAQGHNPQYRHFGALMRYANRVCTLISGGREDAPVAILYHGEAEWAGSCMLMQKPARICLDHQISFYFVPADAFSEREFYGTNTDGRLSVNGRAFKTLVLPYAQYVTPETAKAALELAQHGGQTIVLDKLPDACTNLEPLPESFAASVEVVPLGGLARKLKALSSVELTPGSERIRALYNRDGEELIYLFNEGDSLYEGTARLPFCGPVCAYNAWDNRLERVECVDENTVKLALHPNHSLILLPGSGRTAAEPLAMRGEAEALTHFARSVCHAVDYPRFSDAESIDRLESYHLKDKRFSGFIRYETDFEAGGAFTGLEISDAYEGVEVFVNGVSAGIQIAAPFCYDLTPKCKAGMNVLAVEVATTLERERGAKRASAPTGITGNVTLYRA